MAPIERVFQQGYYFNLAVQFRLNVLSLRETLTDEISKNKVEPRTETKRMRVRARIINLIGEELISDEAVAIVELVKNAYDADARSVSVSFEGADPSAPTRIVVEDDGHGMDFDAVANGWLEPGTARKKKNDHSPSGRQYQGAKGIGRFATARLGSSLLLETKSDNSDDAIIVLLDWGRFTEESYLDDIELEFEVRSDPGRKHGTKLTIEGLGSSAWTGENFERLHARLSRLISPFKDIDDFEVNLDIPSQPDLSGKVLPPDLLLRPKYHLVGVVDIEGDFTGSITVDGKSTQINRKLARGMEIPQCGAFGIDIRAWDRDREGLDPIAMRENMSISEIRRLLNTYSGVAIYRDGFRVHPYGESGNDWLNLDLRSRQNPVKNLANNQIIAALRISRHANPDLKDRSTREGMIKNSAHEALEDWFRRVINVLEEVRYSVRPREEKHQRSEQLFEAFDIKSAAKETERSLGKTHPIAKLISETERQVSEGVDRVQEVFSRLLMSAGLGHMIDIVIHEIGAPLGKLGRQLTILERQLKKLLSEGQFSELASTLIDMRAWLDQIVGLRQRLDPQTPGRRGRATTFDVAQEVNLTFELYAALIEKQGVTVELKKPAEPLKARMSRAILSQVLANLVDNALFWIVQKYGEGNGGHIRAVVKQIDGGFSIRVADDGAGVPEKNRDLIFDPYFSTKPNGIGLGLYIARLVIEPYGKLIYHDDNELHGADFEARFEKGVGL